MLFRWNKRHIENLNQSVSIIFTGQNAEQAPVWWGPRMIDTIDTAVATPLLVYDRYPRLTPVFINKFIIRVLEEEEKVQARWLIMQELLSNDPIVTVLNFDPVSEHLLMMMINKYLDQNIALGCFTRYDNTLVSVDCLYVRNLNDEFPKPKEKKEWPVPFARLMNYVRKIETAINNPKKCNYLTSFGVFTLAEHRDIGIPTQMIRIRTKIAEALRIEVLGSAFIGAEMLAAAKKYNYKKRRTFNGPEDMAELDLDFALPADIFPIKVMTKKISNRVESPERVRLQMRNQQAAAAERQRNEREANAERQQNEREASAERQQNEREANAERQQNEREANAERQQNEREANAERQQNEREASAERQQNEREANAERQQNEREASAERQQNEREANAERQQNEREASAERQQNEREASAERQQNEREVNAERQKNEREANAERSNS